MNILTAQRRLDLSNYVMVWNDEFDYTGTQNNIHYQMFDAPNAKWLNGFSYKTPFTGTIDSTNNIRIITRSNVNVSGGTLKLTSRYGIEPTTVTWKDVDYTSDHTCGILTAKYDRDYYCLKTWDDDGDGIDDPQIGFNYGVFEIRAKLPRKIGDYSAFWFWATTRQCGNDGQPFYATCHPQTPEYTGLEIDVFESKQNSPNEYVYWASQLANNLTDPPCTYCKTYYDWNNSDNSETFHTYTFAWTPTQMTWFIDGNEIRTQTDGIPPFKMDLILSLTNWGQGQSEDYEIDYVRVYRPDEQIYTASPYYDAGNYVGDFIWDGRGDTDYMGYVNSYQNTPYFLNENYKVYQGPTLTGTPASIAVRNVSVSNDLIFYNKSGKLYQLSSFGASNLTTPNVIVSSGVHSNSNIAVSGSSIFWKDTNNRLKVRYWDGSSYSQSYVDVSYQYPNDVSGNITVSPPNNEHGTRVYYISTNNNRLCYYEYCSGWYRHETPITAVAEFTISSNPQGKIFYKGLDNHVWVIWKFWDDNTPCNNSNPVSDWNYGPLDYPYSATYADCAGDLTVHPDGSKVYYRTPNGSLAYWDMTTVQRIITDVHDVVGKIRIKETTDGRTEIFYIANSTNNGSKVKLKSYYERKAPQINGNSIWENSTLDVFSSGQGGISGTSYQTGYYVENLLEINTGYPTKVYYVDNDVNKIGIYRNNPKYNPVPPPYANCSEETDWHNGFEGKQGNYPLGEEYALSTKPPVTNTPERIYSSENLIYPNPTSGQINITLSDTWCGAIIRVIDWTGRTISIQNEVCQSTEIDLSKYPKGIYLIQINYNGQLETKKIFKN
jgi:beta-glucanase (GH16 family)